MATKKAVKGKPGPKPGKHLASKVPALAAQIKKDFKFISTDPGNGQQKVLLPAPKSVEPPPVKQLEIDELKLLQEQKESLIKRVQETQQEVAEQRTNRGVITREYQQVIRSSVEGRRFAGVLIIACGIAVAVLGAIIIIGANNDSRYYH